MSPLASDKLHRASFLKYLNKVLTCAYTQTYNFLTESILFMNAADLHKLHTFSAKLLVMSKNIISAQQHANVDKANVLMLSGCDGYCAHHLRLAC